MTFTGISVRTFKTYDMVGAQEWINEHLSKTDVELAIKRAHRFQYNYYLIGDCVLDWEQYLVCLHRWEPDLVHPFID